MLGCYLFNKITIGLGCQTISKLEKPVILVFPKDFKQLIRFIKSPTKPIFIKGCLIISWILKNHGYISCS